MSAHNGFSVKMNGYADVIVHFRSNDFQGIKVMKEEYHWHVKAHNFLNLATILPPTLSENNYLASPS